jgi:hypothetical protein
MGQRFYRMLLDDSLVVLKFATSEHDQAILQYQGYSMKNYATIMERNLC